MAIRNYLVFLTLCTYSFVLRSQPSTDMKIVRGGTYVPLYGLDSSEVVVDDFYLDVYPITNQQYQVFVADYPEWRKSKVIRLFADASYLRKWANDSSLATGMDPISPVTNVSWYTAKAYCESQGKRLPTMDEWEYTAMASEELANAQTDSLFNQRIIEGYETPRTFTKQIGSTFKNYWGIYDLHGLVWEWTYDFNAVLISGESRKDVDADKKLFCAGGSVGSTDLMNYAAFMRYAFRGSVRANYSIQNLGFRCAKSIP